MAFLILVAPLLYEEVPLLNFVDDAARKTYRGKVTTVQFSQLSEREREYHLSDGVARFFATGEVIFEFKNPSRAVFILDGSVSYNYEPDQFELEITRREVEGGIEPYHLGFNVSSLPGGEATTRAFSFNGGARFVVYMEIQKDDSVIQQLLIFDRDYVPLRTITTMDGEKLIYYIQDIKISYEDAELKYVVPADTDVIIDRSTYISLEEDIVIPNHQLLERAAQ